MRSKAKRYVQGSISILLVIILMPMLTMSAIVVDSSRLNLAKSMVSSAGDLTVNTALANYDTILKDVYGLFAMSQTDSEEDFQKRIREYFEKTLVGYGVTDEEHAKDYVEYLESGISGYFNGTSDVDEISRNFMNMVVEDDFKATKVENSSLANSEILRTQLVEYMKYRAPLSVGLSFLDSLKSFTTIQDQTTVVKTQVVAQESAQDVTSACKNSIEAIRDFDKLIDSIESGDKAVKGYIYSTDGKTVPLDEYGDQTGMYKSIWKNDNYAHINKLTLVFFTKNPGIGDKVLGKLGSTKFIDKNNSYKLTTDNSGVSVSVSLAGDKDSAKSQYDGQLSKVNSLVSKINTYVNQNFLPTGYINADSTAFVNEDGATNSYISFEKFLLDQHSTINHKDIKDILEQLLIYRKYFENYLNYLKEIEKKEKTDKEAAQSEYDNKSSAYDSAVSSRNSIISNANKYKDWIENSNKPYIDKQTSGFKKDISFLSSVKYDGKDLKTMVDDLLKTISINSTTRNVKGQNFRNYSNLTGKISGSGVAKNVYLEVLGKIAMSDIPNADSSLLKKAKEYYDKKNSGKTSKSFSEYVNVDKNSDLYALFNMLDLCSTKANTMLANIRAYNAEVNKYSSAYTNAANALSEKNQANTKLNQEKTEYNIAVANRKNLDTEYNNTMAKFVNGVGRYQTDLSTYGKYTKTAQNVATKEANAIKKQFSEIESNLKAIVDQLKKIETNLDTAKEMIEAYNKNVKTWSDQNKSYASKNGSDTFSEQNSSEIDATEHQYDLKQLKNLQDYVTSMKDEYSVLYNYIKDASNYKYGTTKIDAIDSASKLTSAVSGIKDSLPDVVTANNAKEKFDSLYPYYIAPKILQESHQKKFLSEQILPLQFLIYLNTNYPEAVASTNTSSSNSSSNTSSNSSADTTEASYNSAKKQLKSGTTPKDEPSGFGYTYKDKTVPDDLPSQTKDETQSVDTFKMNEADGKIDASSGFAKQASILDNVLSGIGNVATKGLENLYLLSYIFENFSYNTLVQDIVADKIGDTAATSTTKSKITPTAYTPDLIAKTLSNYKIDKNNNYLYGGEIEYILYGSKTPSKNVTTAKGIIYALRFAFNCIYAFTDSEIKTMTMSAGLAVQAATLGVVPYQIVQIVLQLALAAGESAIDLDYISNGMKVAVVKSRETWNLSLSGAKNQITDIANIAIDATAKKLTSTVNGGIQKVLDSATDELGSAINELSSDLESAVDGKAEEIVNTAFSEVTSRITDALNQVQFIDYSKGDAKQEINKIFDEAKNYDLASLFPDNEIAQTIISSDIIQNSANSIIDGVKNKVLAVCESAPDSLSTEITKSINKWKTEAMNTVNNAVKSTFISAKDLVNGYAKEASEKIGNFATGKVNEMTETAAEELKEKVSAATNDFMNKYIADGNAKSTMGSGLDATTSDGGTSLANIIAFGYKDYLMLFTYLKLCTSSGPESTVMKRIADVIQMNIQNNTQGEYKHKANTESGKFLMSKARTYVQIEATVHLDMLFLDMDFFNRMIVDENSPNGKVDVESDLAGTKIKYSGFLGY